MACCVVVWFGIVGRGNMVWWHAPCRVVSCGVLQCTLVVYYGLVWCKVRCQWCELKTQGCGVVWCCVLWSGNAREKNRRKTLLKAVEKSEPLIPKTQRLQIFEKKSESFEIF